MILVTSVTTRTPNQNNKSQFLIDCFNISWADKYGLIKLRSMMELHNYKIPENPIGHILYT